MAPRNVIKGHITFEKINLNPTYYIFNDIKNIDTNLLNINKTYANNTDAVIYEIKYIMMQSINNQNVDDFDKRKKKSVNEERKKKLESLNESIFFAKPKEGFYRKHEDLRKDFDDFAFK